MNSEFDFQEGGRQVGRTMSMRLPVLLFLCAAFVAGTSALSAQTPSATGKLDKQVKSVSGKRFGVQSWNGSKQSRIRQKSFPLEHYDKHFSSLGRQRSGINVKEERSKEQFRLPDLKEFDKSRSIEFSKWNQHMTDLEKQARIGTDDSMQEIMDKQRYNMMLQDTPRAYAELAEQLSMKDINRFAFRRNRSAAAPSAEQAGGQVAPSSK
ncbi:hypothetical protein [Coraliomargarita akajimensis]|uniref:Uncharacterized protein n=1 Tax=Coraliomargarita akajimensis (strain DSM 45221 / IAM 15411 / JCM 23193 / KCTC 12865 / 04OKA010-24) TaxID=583355 RepID=D5EJ07_CORAD|nr:hypothetical protein [Coraliomargarita akajimensis]ADE54406.1 hypothetical protein Caka_1387 [Coraliomargarita akajimensis DSM 45221]